MFKVNTAIKKLRKLSKRIKVVKGGTFAGKTYCIIALLIDRALTQSEENKIKVTVVAESIPSLKEGAITQFKDIMQSTLRWFDDKWNATDRTYTCENGSVLKFDSYDTIGKAKASGKRNILFVNEANHQHFEIVDTLMTRTTDEIWIDFNPDNEFWVDSEIIPRDDSESIILTYLDNEYTPQTIIDDLEYKLKKAETSDYWRNWCDVYVFGKTGNLEGQVFPSWQVVDSIPADAKYIATGLDFGHSPDPTAMTDVYQKGKELYFDEVVYQTEMSNSELTEAIKANTPKGLVRQIFADHNSNLINELRLRGIHIQKAWKGKVVDGIKILQDYDCFITSTSHNARKEQKHYIWATDKRTGKRSDVPIDAWNHFFDSCRYAVMSYNRTDISNFEQPEPPVTMQTKFNKGLDTGSAGIQW